MEVELNDLGCRIQVDTCEHLRATPAASLLPTFYCSDVVAAGCLCMPAVAGTCLVFVQNGQNVFEKITTGCFATRSLTKLAGSSAAVELCLWHKIAPSQLLMSPCTHPAGGGSTAGAAAQNAGAADPPAGRSHLQRPRQCTAPAERWPCQPGGEVAKPCRQQRRAQKSRR